ncbi:MAG TPA: DinB family protein [Puia sp.]|nr:DinB family protein [Puia sp.]
MNKEVQSIIKSLNTVLNDQPWFGKSVYELLEEAGKLDVYKKPSKYSHSLIELLYHMITWAEFTLASLRKAKKHEIDFIENLDWREIDTTKHNWGKGIHEFKSANQSIISFLETQQDDLLNEIVEFRQYNMRFLLNGLIQHHIYHTGQIVYLAKLLK